ncbi:MAG TPA: hypothetical protein PLA27_11680 [Anaerolineales bacterium]|jgi:hypothetical protein|nr:hypothetical protein [Anaerolineales bacterium]HQX17075.1 hypothetical protein [Anaerolineales bacterium]
MSDAIAILCFGWPAIIGSFLLSIVGVLMKKPNLLFVAGVALIPFTYYLSNGLRNPFVVIPLFQFASAFAIRRGNTRLAWLLLLPFLVVTLWLAFVVLTQ